MGNLEARARRGSRKRVHLPNCPDFWFVIQFCGVIAIMCPIHKIHQRSCFLLPQHTYASLCSGYVRSIVYYDNWHFKQLITCNGKFSAHTVIIYLGKNDVVAPTSLICTVIMSIQAMHSIAISSNHSVLYRDLPFHLFGSSKFIQYLTDGHVATRNAITWDRLLTMFNRWPSSSRCRWVSDSPT
jgi:hypothetical protein